MTAYSAVKRIESADGTHYVEIEVRDEPRLFRYVESTHRSDPTLVNIGSRRHGPGFLVMRLRQNAMRAPRCLGSAITLITETPGPNEEA